MTKYPIVKGPGLSTRLALLLWGPAGAGKTTWAATAPGKKLWVSYGDNEHVSVAHREDVLVMDLTAAKATDVFQDGIGDSPYGIDKTLSDDEDIQTVVVDSLTMVQQLALEKAVGDKVGMSQRFTPTWQTPGLSAYGGRNVNLIMLMKSFLRVTSKHGVNIIFTAHENDPNTRPDGTIDEIRASIGGRLVNAVTSSMSEIWNLRQDPGGKRYRIVTVRPQGWRKPLKTRMFLQNGESSFNLEYDPSLKDDHPKQMTIADFCNQWWDSDSKRISVPKNRGAKVEEEENQPKIIKDTV